MLSQYGKMLNQEIEKAEKSKNIKLKKPDNDKGLQSNYSLKTKAFGLLADCKGSILE
jgi:hypothetical protein